MLFTGLGRSVFGETVPSVRVPPSAYGLGRYSRPRAQLLPIRTSQPVYNIYIHMCHGNSGNSNGCSYIFSGFALFTELMWVCRGVESLCKLLTAKKVPFDTKKRVQIKILSILKLVSFKSLTEKRFFGKIWVLKKQATKVILVGWFGKSQSIKKVVGGRHFVEGF